MRLRIFALLIPSAFALALLMGGTTPALAGGGFCHQPATDGTGVTVEMTNLCFSPTVLRVQPGATVTWVNRDSFEHLVTGVSGSFGGFDRLGPGKSVTQTFKTPGTFPYTCSLHFGMSGAVVVGDGNASLAGDAQINPVAATATALTHDAGAWPAMALGLAVLAGVIGFALGRLRRSPVTS